MNLREKRGSDRVLWKMSDLVVYRISTVKEWAELQSNGSTFGGELDKSTGFIHLSKLDQASKYLTAKCKMYTKRTSL
ncbi:hypothetical protein P8452_67686 [Trifolium repens]|nr:hypothetical protein P8452_67686 [Trifolium repens]